MDERQEADRSASMASSIVNLLSTIIGAGILGLPYAFAHTGVVLGLLSLSLFGLFAWIGLHLLALCATMCPTQPLSFHSVASLISPMFSVIVDISVCMKCFGVATVYLTVVGDLMPIAIKQLDLLSSPQMKQRETWICLGFFTIAGTFSSDLHM